MLARLGTSTEVPGLAWLPLRDAAPVTLCLTQRRDSRPSPAALIVRRLIRAEADALTA